MQKKIVLGVILVFLSSTINALVSFDGKVTVVEPSYLPGTVAFIMSTGIAMCPAGSWLWWKNADPENNKAVYATLMTALAADKNVRFHINDGDTTCTGIHLHLIK